MITKERQLEAGANLLKEAKEDRASRTKSTNDEIHQSCLSGAKFFSTNPISLGGDPAKAFDYRQKHKISCCICGITAGQVSKSSLDGITAGTFFVENREAFCSKHKEAMYMDKKERKEYQENVNL